MTKRRNPCTVLACLAVAGSAQAVTYTEIGDAGGTIATAQDVGAGLFTVLAGTLTEGDTDVFRITIPFDFTYTISNLQPDILFDNSYDVFDLFTTDAAGTDLSACGDCWWEISGGPVALSGSDVAGTYYLRIEDADEFGGDPLGAYRLDISITPTTTIPLPAGAFLLGAGGLALAGLRRRKAA